MISNFALFFLKASCINNRWTTSYSKIDERIIILLPATVAIEKGPWIART